MMANPPSNVDMVDAEKVKDGRRLPFGLPGVNKGKKVSNANYLWISYFQSYLGPKGRAGFVMSSQASSAGHGEAEVRRKIVETGDADVMISIRSNFFYTRTLPCELWFFDKGKPKERRDQMLMLDARKISRKVTRKNCDFSPEQLADLTAIVWLHRGETKRFAALLDDYRGKIHLHWDTVASAIPDVCAEIVALERAIRKCGATTSVEFQCAATAVKAFRGTHVTIVRPQADIGMHYIGDSVLRCEPRLSTMGRGATNQTELSRGDIGGVEIVVPPPPLVKRFEDFAGPLFAQVVNLTFQAQNLRTARDLLLPRLMSGELTV
jgi:hypothetical protein